MENEKLRPIRVLHCIHSLTSGGAERQLLLLAGISHKYRMRAGIFCVNSTGSESLDPSVKIYKSLQVNKYDMHIFSSLAKAIENFKPDILHAWLPAPMTIPTMLLATLYRIPCVWSYRNSMFFKRPLTLVEFLLAWPCASCIISNNPIVRSSMQYRAIYKIKRGIEIRNAVSVERRYCKMSVGKTATFECRILFAGRITHQKNWQCLLKALPVVLRTYKLKVIICGEGEDEAQLRVMVDQLGLTSVVSHVGYQSNIHEVMQQSDVLVLPSWYEGMSNVFLEALSIGLPCVVSDIPANLDIIDGTGCALTFPPSSADALAARLLELFGSPSLRCSLAQRGREVAAQYSLERLAEAHRAAYCSILARSPSQIGTMVSPVENPGSNVKS
nr:glycosyltransferase family 4 protein [Nitrosomonas nitrosa]